MMRRLLICLLFVTFSANAAKTSTLEFSLDNDGIMGTDEDYTNGIFLSYTSGAIQAIPLLEPLSLSYWGTPSLDKFEFQLGHKMWTPSDIEASVPQENDRPYAGYFHGELNYISITPHRAHRVNLTLGVTGENSFADKAQSLVHQLIGSPSPNGWGYQIDNQVAGSIGYSLQQKWLRAPASVGGEWELSHVAEANVGNFRSDLSSGVMLRWGQDLQSSFGATSISAENPFKAGMINAPASGWFTYTGIEIRYRFNDITIEGPRSAIPEQETTYDVDLQHLQGTTILGAAWYNQHLGIASYFALKTPDYQQASKSFYSNGGVSLFVFF